MTLIDTTEHYELQVGANPYSNGKDEYLVVNIETGVIEADSRLLPMARKYMMSLEAMYAAQLDIEQDEETNTEDEIDYIKSLNVTPFKKH